MRSKNIDNYLSVEEFHKMVHNLWIILLPMEWSHGLGGQKLDSKDREKKNRTTQPMNLYHFTTLEWYHYLGSYKSDSKGLIKENRITQTTTYG